MRMSRLFYAVWLLTAAALLAGLTALPEAVGSPGKALDRSSYVITQLLALASLGLCSPAFVQWLGRAAPGQVNVPHRDYWMAEPRRDATLARLGEHVSAIGALAVLLLAGIHLQMLLDAHPDWPQPPQALWWAGAAALAVGAVAACWRVYRAFPAPPPAETAPLRRPRRPGEGR